MRKVFKRIFETFISLMPKYLRVIFLEKLSVIEKSSFPNTEIKFYCRSRTELYCRREEYKGEPETVGWIRSYFDGGVFFDVGANVGTFSLIAASLGKVKKVYSFEPSYTTFLSLCENVRVNGLEKVIVPCHLALGDKNEIVDFFYHGLTPGASLHNLGKNIDYSGRKFQESFVIPMMSCKIDKFIEYFDVPSPNYIKIDVDGIELKIIHGMTKTLRNPQLKTIIIEVNRNQEKEFENILSSFGFVLDTDIMKLYKVQPHPVTGSINLVFVRR